MRIGRNPYLHKELTLEKKILDVVSVVFIPQLSGYFLHSLEILKYSLESLGRHTDVDFNLVVFDNNSCKEVRDYLVSLQESGRIHILILSGSNVGKVGALNRLIPITTCEYVGYFDSDVFFHPGWFPASKSVLDKIPGAGMVTGISERLQNQFFNKKSYALVKKDNTVNISEGDFLSQEDHEKVAEGLGTPLGEYLKSVSQLRDIKLNVEGCSAYLGAKHFQFLSKKVILEKIIPLQEDVAMGKLKKIDKHDMENVALTGDFQIDSRIDGLGLLRLSTTKTVVEHIGNSITPRMAALVMEYLGIEPKSSKKFKKNSIYDNKMVKRMLLKIYNKIFTIYLK